RLHLHEAAVDERERHHRHERDRLLRIEPRHGIADERQPEGATPLRRLRLGWLGCREEAAPAREPRDGSSATSLQQITPAEGTGNRLLVHERTSSAAGHETAMTVRTR